MKTIIPFVMLLICSIQLQNCRPSDEAENTVTTLNYRSKVDSASGTSVKNVDNDPDPDDDPPVKDGQDWRYKQN